MLQVHSSHSVGSYGLISNNKQAVGVLLYIRCGEIVHFGTHWPVSCTLSESVQTQFRHASAEGMHQLLFLLCNPRRLRKFGKPQPPSQLGQYQITVSPGPSAATLHCRCQFCFSRAAYTRPIPTRPTACALLPVTQVQVDAGGWWGLAVAACHCCYSSVSGWWPCTVRCSVGWCPLAPANMTVVAINR